MKVYKEKFSRKWQWMCSFCEHKNETKRKRKEDIVENMKTEKYATAKEYKRKIKCFVSC